MNFELYILYSQVAVFQANLPNPFNDWRPQHIAQGFSWRSESACFSTLDESGVLQVEVRIASDVTIKAETRRAILVPFSVQQLGLVEISSIGRGERVSIPTGRYALVFETGYKNEGMWSIFTFVPRESTQTEILRADAGLSPSYPLLMEAHPAGQRSKANG